MQKFWPPPMPTLKPFNCQHCYSNLPLKYALWTRVIGAHLVGRCVLYSYHFLDLLIEWIATGTDETWANPLHQTSTMWNHCNVEKTKCTKQAGTRARVWSQWRHHPESLGQSWEHTATNSNLLRHLLNLKVLLTSKAFKFYTTLSSTSTTNCFAPMFKHNMNRHMMNCNNCLRRFIETLTNWHWFSINKFMHSWQMTLHDMFKQ